MKPVEWAWWFVKNVKGGASLEHGMVAGTAVLVATTMAAGLGSTGADGAKQSQGEVTESIEISQTNLVQVGKVELVSADTVVAVGSTTVVEDNAVVTLAAGQTVRAVGTIIFYVKNPGSKSWDLSSLNATYLDETQKVDLNDPSVAITVDETGKIITSDRVQFNFVTGNPFPDSGATGSPPAIGSSDLVEVMVSVAGLTNRITTNTKFSIELQPPNGLAFTLEKATPDELSDNASLD